MANAFGHSGPIKGKGGIAVFRSLYKPISLALALAVALMVFPSPAMGAFPEKDIMFIVPWAAGGGTDTVARALVKNAKKYFGVNVNVVNQTGGMGAVGMGAVMTARPDGYTVGMITFQLSTYRIMGITDLSYRDFALIGLVNRSPASISVKADSPIKSLKELFDYAKANPGVVTVGHSGVAGGWHLSIASLAAKHGLNLKYVPFDGAAPTRTALLGGHITVATTGIDEVLPFYKVKQVRILAVNDYKRHPMFPDVPTIAEAGFPQDPIIFDWRGLGAPKGTPPDRMKVLIEGFKKSFDDPEFIELMDKLALRRVYEDPKGFEKFLQGMEDSLRPVLKDLGLAKEK